MPLEDVVSPIIQAFIAGRQLKERKERAIQEKQEAEDQSKIRKLQAQQIEKTISRFDKMADLNEQAATLKNKASQMDLVAAVTKGVEDGTIEIPEEVIEAATEASGGTTPGMLGMLMRTPKTAPAKQIDLGGGQMFDTSLIPTRQQIIANKLQNRRLMDVADIEKAQAVNNIQVGGQSTLLDKQFGQADKVRKETFGQQTTLADLKNKRDIALQERKEKAAKLLADEANRTRIQAANISANASKANTNARINAKDKIDQKRVDELKSSAVDYGFVTRQGLMALGDTGKETLLQATKEGRKVLTDTQDKETLGIVKINSILEKMDRVTRAIGNGAPEGFIWGSELKQDYDELAADLGELSRTHGNVGAQSDKDIARAGGLIMDRFGQNVKQKNLDKMKRLRKSQIMLLDHYYPKKSTNPIQYLNMAEKFGIPLEEIQEK